MKKFLLTAAMLTSTAFGAQAATVLLDTDDFTFTGGTLQGGNCPDAGPCLQLAGNNNPGGITMTYSGGAFTLTSFIYTLQGTSGVKATGSDAAGVSGVFEDLQSGGNSGTLTAALAAGSTGVTGDFVDILDVVFTNIGTGAVRIEGFAGTAPMPMAPVPLPAAGMLLLTALGGFAAFGRRKA